MRPDFEGEAMLGVVIGAIVVGYASIRMGPGPLRWLAGGVAALYVLSGGVEMRLFGYRPITREGCRQDFLALRDAVRRRWRSCWGRQRREHEWTRAALVAVEEELGRRCEVLGQGQEALRISVDALHAMLDSGQIARGRRCAALDVASREPTRLDVASREPVRLDVGAGFLLVSCTGVEPAAEGAKVRLRVGNPFMAAFDGFAITARWGPRYAGAMGDFLAYQGWLDTLEAGRFDFDQALLAGAWNEVELVLECGMTAVGCIHVSIETGPMRLLEPWEAQESTRGHRGHPWVEGILNAGRG
jgi:hypothetical protein